MIESVLAASDSVSNSTASAGAGFVLLLIGAVFYFLPTILAGGRHHQLAARLDACWVGCCAGVGVYQSSSNRNTYCLRAAARRYICGCAADSREKES